MNSLSKGLPVIRRHRDNDLANLSWDNLIDEILSNPILDESILSELESKKNLCKSKSSKLTLEITKYDDYIEKQNRISSLFWKREEILCKEEYSNFNFSLLIEEEYEKVLPEFIKIIRKNQDALLRTEPSFWKFWSLISYRKNRKRINCITEKILNFSGFPSGFLDLENEEPLSTLGKFETLLLDLQLLDSFEKEHGNEIAEFDQGEHRKKCNLLINELKDHAIKTLRLQLKAGLHSYNDNERQLLSTAQVMMKQLDDATSDLTIRELSRQLEFTFETLISKVPLLAVTNLSTMSVFPSTNPCQFDLLVVDEASQCDIPSTIPLLFRAKRVCVIGDPKQLKAIHSMKGSMHSHLKEKSRLLDFKYAPYDYLTKSFFDLASHWCKEEERTMLREHFRCHSRIADYCNDVSYNNDLFVLTDESRLNGDYQGRRGLYWEDVVGVCDRVPGGGSKCIAEAEAVVEIVNEMSEREESNFTLGVVSPFKAQANLIKEKLEEKLRPDAWNKMNLRVATADGFQGDERDVIIFSITCQPKIKRGSLWFIAQEKNRWNVAVSRAKSLLYIVGNKNFCKDSDIPHVRRLAEHAEIENSFEGKAFDSPWEEKLFNALQKAGVETVPQHPIAGYRLDLAIPHMKIDIEVDGVQYHRDEFGNRKSSDLWRDMTIENLGWSVIRFWVYELNENMPGCIKEVQNMIKSKSNK
jgi:very-short-patch-repair endonuclease